MALPEIIDFQNKKWVVIAKIPGQRVDDHTKLKSMYDGDLVLKNSDDMFFILNKVIDVEFTEL